MLMKRLELSFLSGENNQGKFGGYYHHCSPTKKRFERAPTPDAGGFEVEVMFMFPIIFSQPCLWMNWT